MDVISIANGFGDCVDESTEKCESRRNRGPRPEN